MKGIAKPFRPDSSPEERTAFVRKAKKCSDNGSIPKDSNMGVSEDIGQSKGVDSGEKPKMTLLRKLCFFLSLNGYVLYVAAFLWFIPCRQPFCNPPEMEWSTNISARLTTNMETINYGGNPSVLFGYSDETGAKLASLAISDGKTAWNKSSGPILRHVFCQLSLLLGRKNPPFCVMTATNYIGAFNVANGETLWEQNITNPNGEAIHKIALAEQHLFCIDDTLLFVLNADNGTVTSSAQLPCTLTIDVKLVGPWKTANATEWAVICVYGDSIEVWTFEEKEMLSLPPPQAHGTADPLLRYDVEFKLLFSSESYIGSIDLAGDVTATPDSFVLSWADIVVMVTVQAPFHHLGKTWERRFSGPLGDLLAVTNITSGRFTDAKESQIAISLKDGLNSTIHILESKNGTTVSSFSLGMRSVMSMEKITSEHETDVLLCETVENVEISSSPSTRTYFRAKYRNKKWIFQKVVTAELYVSKMSQFYNDTADLFTASRSPTGETTLSRHIITTKHLEKTCSSS